MAEMAYSFYVKLREVRTRVVLIWNKIIVLLALWCNYKVTSGNEIIHFVYLYKTIHLVYTCKANHPVF